MTITITVPPETEAKLRQRAAERGQTVDGYVRQLVERDVLVGDRRPSAEGSAVAPPLPSDAALAPFRADVARTGMTDDELRKYFEDVREEVYQEKHGRPGKAS